MFGWLKKSHRNADLIASAVKAATAGAERERIVRALATIPLSLDPSLDDKRFCVKAVVSLVRELARLSDKGPIWISDDQRFVSGIFSFTISNSLSFRLSLNFEEIAYISSFVLLDDSEDIEGIEDSENTDQDINDVAFAYNKLTSQGPITESIGSTFSRWLVQPTNQNFKKLVELYSFLALRVKNEGNNL